MPTFNVDIYQDEIEADYYYRLLPYEGFVNALGPKTFHIAVEMLLSLERHTQQYCKLSTLKQAKYLMHLLLSLCLGSKQLKSRSLSKTRSQYAK